MASLSRRAFLGALAAAALVGGPAAASGAVPAETRGWTWRGGIAGRTAQAVTAEGRRVIAAPFPFNAVGVTWLAGAATPRLRVSLDGSAWSDWRTITTHEMHGRGSAGAARVGDLAVVPSSRYLELDADGPIDGLAAHLIDSQEGPSAAAAPRIALGTAVPVIPRAGWGCDERLRFDRNGETIWPAEFAPVEKVVVHHSATENREADPAQTVRAIYFYHAVSLGWGDIGYNFLVDWRGNVYEGRYGGSRVAGGHAYGHNEGSLGIACLGNFSSAGVTIEMRRSLARLIAQASPWLDPQDSGWFVDGTMPNLMGHRDAMQYRPADATECPGTNLYALLPGLRGDVLYNLGTKPLPGVSIVDVDYLPRPLVVPGILRVKVTLANTGGVTLPTQLPEPGLLYDERESWESRGLTGHSGAWRLGLDLGGGPAAGDYPFRWGLPSALEPGRRVTIEGLVRIINPGQRSASIGVVREWRQWLIQGANSASVATMDSRDLNRRTFVPNLTR